VTLKLLAVMEIEGRMKQLDFESGANLVCLRSQTIIASHQLEVCFYLSGKISDP
jgi:hypothetical protein